MKTAIIACFAILTTSGTCFADEWRDRGVEEIKTTKVVVDAMFTQSISLWVSVQDDGTRRDGLAESFCVDLFSSGMPVGETVIITIWDAAAMARDELAELGKSYCERKGDDTPTDPAPAPADDDESLLRKLLK